jgi:SAM-dependent methyltransferase
MTSRTRLRVHRRREDWDEYFGRLTRGDGWQLATFNLPPNLKDVLGILARRRARSVLVVGPGPGDVPLIVAANGFQVVSLDLSVVALRTGMARASGVPGLRAAVGDVAALPAEGASFDAALALSVLSLHERDLRLKMAGELARVLCPGGLAFCWHYVRAFPEYLRAAHVEGTLSELYAEIEKPYPGFADYQAHFDAAGNPLPENMPPAGARFWCSWTLGGGRRHDIRTSADQ